MKKLLVFSFIKFLTLNLFFFHYVGAEFCLLEEETYLTININYTF